MKHKQKNKWILAIVPLLILAGSMASGCGVVIGSEVTSEPYRVWVLVGMLAYLATFDVFKAGLAELGYEEGKNFAYQVQVADGNAGKVKQMTQEFLAAEVDLIFSTSRRR